MITGKDKQKFNKLKIENARLKKKVETYESMTEKDLVRSVLGTITGGVKDIKEDFEYIKQAPSIVATAMFYQECHKLIESFKSNIVNPMPTIPTMRKKDTDYLDRGAINGIAMLMDKIEWYEAQYLQTTTIKDEKPDKSKVI